MPAERVRAVLVGVAAVGAVLVPLTREVSEDSFPLSNYPMFTARRPQVTGIERAIGVTAAGVERALPPEVSGGTVEVIHAAQTIVDAIRGGTADDLCAEIAGRLDAGDDVVEVIVVTERFDVIAAVQQDDPVPVDRDVHARCEVSRS